MGRAAATVATTSEGPVPIVLAFALALVGALASSCAPSDARAIRPPSAHGLGAALRAEPEWSPPTAASWRKRAADAAAAGITDVAAASLGLAHAAEPTPSSLRAWIDALTASGQLREARAALDRAGADADRRGDAVLVALVAAERAKMPSAGAAAASTGPLQRATSAALRAGRSSEAAGRLDDALAALAGADDPIELVTLGDLAWRKGDAARARRSWARARVALDELGASLALVPVAADRTKAAFWAGDDLLLLRAVSPIRYGEASSAVLERWSPSDPSAPRQRLLLGREPQAAIPLADGAHLLVGSEHGAAIVDTATGEVESRIELGVDRPRLLAAGGEGVGLGVVVATPKGAELFNRSGKRLDAFVITGTTPTITRVYRGPGAYHDNILDDSPTWATALAVTDDLGRVAIGGSDSKVRLVDRRAKTTKLLEFSWPFRDRRMMGANPDLNEPLDMRFAAGGRELVVLHTRGDVLTWDVATGKAIAHLPGPCTRDEALVDKNRYAEPKGQRLEPTASDMEGCGRASVGVLARDGSRVATSMMFSVRVRSMPTGASEAMLVESLLPGALLAFSKAGRLALVDNFGATALWGSTTGLVHFRPRPVETGPIAPSLSRTGRWLAFDHGRVDVVWDLVRRASVASALGEGATLVAVADDGAPTVVQTKSGVELRGPGGRVTKLEVPSGKVAARFSASAERLLLDVVGDADRRVVVRDLARGTTVAIPVPAASETPILSADGRRVASFGRGQLTAVWDAQTGKSVGAVDPGASHVALAPDGSFVATLERIGNGPKARASIHRFRAAPPQTIDVDGWSADLAVSPDGLEILILLEGGVARWRPSTGERLDDPGEWQHGIRHAHYADNGRVIFFERYDAIEIRRRDDAMTLVATLYPLLSGDWMVVSAEGAVDGSVGAPDSTITRVTRVGEVLALGGRASWDRWHTPDVIAQALRGEIATPPAPGKPLAPVVEAPKPRILTRLR